MWPPGGVTPEPRQRGEVRRWHGLPVRGLVAGTITLAVLVFVFVAVLIYEPKEKAPTQEYLRVRAICEDRATRELSPYYAVGGNHWVDAVNDCMVDLWND